MQPGDQIQLLAFKRYLPQEPQNEILLGSIPTWNVVQEDTLYIPNRQPENIGLSQLSLNQ